MTTTLFIRQTMPGSRGEHDLQERYGTRSRAEAFYKHQVLSYLNPMMRAFIARQEMFFLSTADGHGECDVSFRAGEAGFVHPFNEKTLVYPEYRGNGVMASLGNIAETGGRRPERWVQVTVEEAYIHCSKHIPRLEKSGKEVRHWGTDDVRVKGGDYFRAKAAPMSL